MKNTLLQILLLSAAALCQAAEDPTESLPGVHDLSEAQKSSKSYPYVNCMWRPGTVRRQQHIALLN